MKWMIYYVAQGLLGKAEDLGIPNQKADRASLDRFLDGVYFIVGFMAVIVMIIAGLNYITANGDAAKITKAKNMLVYAVIGLIIALSAFALTNFVIKGATQ